MPGKKQEKDGVWRTVGGRRIFIAEGESLSDAMAKSGKFKNQKKNKKQKSLSQLNQQYRRVEDKWANAKDVRRKVKYSDLADKISKKREEAADREEREIRERSQKHSKREALKKDLEKQYRDAENNGNEARRKMVEKELERIRKEEDLNKRGYTKIGETQHLGRKMDVYESDEDGNEVDWILTDGRKEYEEDPVDVTLTKLEDATKTILEGKGKKDEDDDYNPRGEVNYWLSKGEFDKASKVIKENGLEDEVEDFLEGMKTPGGRSDFRKYLKRHPISETKKKVEEKDVKQAFKDYWDKKISGAELEAIKEDSGLSSGRLDSLKYQASREDDVEKKNSERIKQLEEALKDVNRYGIKDAKNMHKWMSFEDNWGSLNKEYKELTGKDFESSKDENTFKDKTPKGSLSNQQIKNIENEMDSIIDYQMDKDSNGIGNLSREEAIKFLREALDDPYSEDGFFSDDGLWDIIPQLDGPNSDKVEKEILKIAENYFEKKYGREMSAIELQNFKTKKDFDNQMKSLEKVKEDGTFNLATLKPKNYEGGYQVTFSMTDMDMDDESYTKLVEKFKNHDHGNVDAGKFDGYSEISFNVDDMKKAAKLAYKYNQVSIWDWKNGKEILTRGTGKWEDYKPETVSQQVKTQRQNNRKKKLDSLKNRLKK